MLIIIKLPTSWRLVGFRKGIKPFTRCHNCGYINKNLTLKDRQWVCPQCGEIIERDYNAALNILDEGLRIIGSSTTEFTLVDYPTVDDPIRNDLLKSSDRLKQEVNNEQV